MVGFGFNKENLTRVRMEPATSGYKAVTGWLPSLGIDSSLSGGVNLEVADLTTALVKHLILFMQMR